jgi:hypothetical protein
VGRGQHGRFLFASAAAIGLTSPLDQWLNELYTAVARSG